MQPEPLIQVAIEPTSVDRDRLAATLHAISRQLGLDVRADYERGLITLGGVSEEQLSGAVVLLRTIIAEGYNVGPPQVAYREYLAKPVDIDYTHKKQSGGTGQFARVKVKVTPGERGIGLVFKDGSIAVTFPRNISRRSKRAFAKPQGQAR